MKRNAFLAATAAIVIAGLTTQASAGAWARHHPRRVEVNSRERVQNKRILHNYRQGNISADEARSLHQDVHGVRQEERADAGLHGGHLSKSELKTLNQDQNGVSREIYDTAHD